jgi:hypothetical protein
MPIVLYRYIQQWCQEHGWTDLFIEQRQFWAFPPGSFIPVPVPASAVKRFYAKYRPTTQVRVLSLSVMGVALGAVVLTVLTLSPVPLLLGFGCCAIAVALLEPEYI